MSMQNLKVSRGEIITFTSGEYSDFGVCGYLVFTQDVDLAKFAQKHFSGKPQYGDHSSAKGLPSYLVAEGLAMPVDKRDIHIGCYEDFNSEFGVVWAKKDEKIL